MTAMSAIPQTNPHVQKSSLPPTYEFTKRKRWADLLHTEPTDSITFVLSFSSTILHCSLAITELLGWKDVDLIDCDLIDLITSDDQAAFRATFEESIQNKSELHSFVRLQCNGNRSSYFDSNSEDVLFEIKGNPHFARETDGNFFLAVAKAYPCRNTAMFDTYALLKTENERLQQRVVALQNCTSGQSRCTNPTTLSSQWNATGSLYPSSFTPRPTGFDDTPTSSVNISFDSGIYYNDADEDNVELSRKKKVRKTCVGEQYVCITCGRTDSPEWRKGPLGPKTLCNACGLRWAKQMRRSDDPSEGGGETVNTALTIE